jgi:hypothetical protein
MKLAKSILCGAAALGMAGAAFAQDEQSSGMNASQPILVYEETYVIADPAFDGLVAWNDSPSSDVTYFIYDADAIGGGPERGMQNEQGDTQVNSSSDADLYSMYVD